MSSSPVIVRQIIEQLQQQLFRGVICPGQKLPSQRKMAESMGVSRASVREAIAELQARGMIETHHGGGSFSRNLLEPLFQPPVLQSSKARTQGALSSDQSDHDLQRQVMEMREMLEGEAAYFAALRASDRQLQALSTEYQRMLERGVGETTLKKAKADLRFHMLIAESSHNLLVMSFSQLLYTRYFNAIYGVLSRTLQQTGRYPPRISLQHTEIYQAILARKPLAARAAAIEHMRYTRQQLADSYSKACR